MKYLLILILFVPALIVAKLCPIEQENEKFIRHRVNLISNEITRIKSRIKMYKNDRIDIEIFIAEVENALKVIEYNLGRIELEKEVTAF
jgi:uncharacterized circularly permuted ATP-grasp superfamily protein